jgi:hypothetical protein
MDTPTPDEQLEQPPQKRARHRPPKSADAKARGLTQRKLERQLAAVKASKDVRKMEEAAALLAKMNGEAAAPEEMAPREAAPKKDAPEAAPPAELRGAPAGSNPRGPGWPSEQAIAEMAPLVRDGIEQLTVLLAGTRFAIDAETRVQVGETTATVRKADQLASGLTPLAAKYLPTALNTPEAVAVTALVMVFGVPLFQLAMEKASAPREPGAA